MKARMKKWIKYLFKVVYPTVNFLVELIFVVLSAFITSDRFFDAKICQPVVDLMKYGWIVSLILKIILFFCACVTNRTYKRMEMSDKLSSAMLKVEQRANAYKTRHVLQITYGSVPVWHPFNYFENVLVYDVHEQLRTLLLELKDAIIATTPDLDDDAVTVDLVYCYPDDNYGGELPAGKNDLDKWVLITSRDGSSMNYKVHDF